jgi:hypothetical protein
MTMNTMKRVAVAATIAALAVPVTMAGPAQASGSDAVKAHGTCSNGATWKLKAKHDDGRIQWEFEVDAKRSGRVWSVRVRDNGTTVFSGKRTTTPPSASFSVERRTANRSGADQIRARATRGAAVCHGKLSV